jgi:hypothetical protein
MSENIIKETKPISDLELYEIIVAAYPDKFKENSEEDNWDEVMDFIASKFDIEELSELLGRLVYLTMPMQSPLTNKYAHCLGKVSFVKNSVNMAVAVKREIEIKKEKNNE